MAVEYSGSDEFCAVLASTGATSPTRWLLRAWRTVNGRWSGYVTYSVGVGLRHIGCLDQDQLRPGLASPPRTAQRGIAVRG